MLYCSDRVIIYNLQATTAAIVGHGYSRVYVVGMLPNINIDERYRGTQCNNAFDNIISAIQSGVARGVYNYNIITRCVTVYTRKTTGLQ